MATTNLEVEMAREKGFEGRVMVAVDHSASPALGWMWTVESQAAETTRECSEL